MKAATEARSRDEPSESSDGDRASGAGRGGAVVAREVIHRPDPVAQRAPPWGGLETPLIFQISPPSVTTYAVFLMNSSEVGWLR